MNKAAQGHGWNQVQIEKKLRAQKRLNAKYKQQQQSSQKKNLQKPPIVKRRGGQIAVAKDDDTVGGLVEDEWEVEGEEPLGEGDDLFEDDDDDDDDG